MTHIRILSLCLGALFATACGGNRTGPRPTAQLQLTTNPASIVPVICPPSSCGSLANQLEATTIATVREAAGVAGTVESVNLVLRRNADNAVLVNAAPTPGTRFAGGGSVDIPLGVHYDINQGGSALTLTVTINARDDNGHQVSATVAVAVAAAYTP